MLQQNNLKFSGFFSKVSWFMDKAPEYFAFCILFLSDDLTLYCDVRTLYQEYQKS